MGQFYDWMKLHSDEDNPTGDFCTDALRDVRFPSSSDDKAEILDYLTERGVDDPILKAFGRTWTRFEMSRG